MKTSRRNFIKTSGLSGLGLASVVKGFAAADQEKFYVPKIERFNMCGYAAPKIETVRIGFIGLGNRGPAAVDRMTYIDGVDIRALCDLRPDKVNAVKTALKDKPYKP